MSLAFRARASSACAGAFAAFAAATVVRHADARASGDVLGARARWENHGWTRIGVHGRATARRRERGWSRSGETRAE